MPLEVVTHISDLNQSNPPGTDSKNQGDDHIRNIKLALRTDLPNINGVVNATVAQLNALAASTVDGQILRRAGGAIAFGPMTILTDIRTGALTLPNATLVNALTVTLEVGRYIFEAFLFYTSPSADDIKFKLAGAATYTVYAQAIDTVIQAMTEASTYSVQSSGSPDGAMLYGHINCTVAGTFIIQAAKQLDTGADGSVNAGAWLRAMRVL
jgi:hypothetical protein